MLKSLLKFVLLSIPIFAVGAFAGWYFLSGIGSEGSHLSRTQVKMIFGDYGLQQYDKILTYNRRYEGSLQVGDVAPDLQLTQVEGGKSHLSDFYREKPMVLIFGSYT